jgi:hypothetical protein
MTATDSPGTDASFSATATAPTYRSASWTSPGAGITGGYDGDSETLRIFIVFFSGLAMYNACELLVMVLLTFKHFHGLYYWSMVVSGVGIIPYSLGFLLKFMNVTTGGGARWLAVSLITVGWYAMVTGQALVLWSRLHLIVSGREGERTLRWTWWMIGMNVLLLHVPTTVLTFGSNGTLHTGTFEAGYNIVEKIQMSGFFAQELILSSIYILETARLLRTSLQPDTEKTMKQLILINVVIIVMDLALLGLECASLYILETLLKGVVYSVKLKLEFAILGKLVKFVGYTKPQRRTSSVGFITTDRQMSERDREMNVDDFVDFARLRADVTRPQTKAPRASDWDVALARFEHVEHLAQLKDPCAVERPHTPPERPGTVRMRGGPGPGALQRRE